ncbi:MAG TPA: 2-oxoglutarate and iron-dependent oxygenase domain-containing protein [Bordetella sp.]
MSAAEVPDFDAIPVIDMSPLFSDASHEAVAKVAARIRKAAVEIGFFYVSGHNVSRDLQQAVYLCSKYFFCQPDETKAAIAINNAHRGYVGFRQTVLHSARKADLKESFNFAYPFKEGDPELDKGHGLVGLNQWPRGEDVWRDVVERYYGEVFELGQRILEGFALALGTRRDFFRDLYRHPLVRARLLHYPPQTVDSQSGQFGAAEHTDYGCITLLWQDDVGGLQVKNRAGKWVDAPYIEGTFVINIGDMLARWSNDLFVSTPHRVVNDSGRERYSIPVFYDPDYETEVECLPNCATAESPPKYPRIVAGDYITDKYDTSYAYRQKGRG